MGMKREEWHEDDGREWWDDGKLDVWNVTTVEGAATFYEKKTNFDPNMWYTEIGKVTSDAKVNISGRLPIEIKARIQALKENPYCPIESDQQFINHVTIVGLVVSEAVAFERENAMGAVYDKVIYGGTKISSALETSIMANRLMIDEAHESSSAFVLKAAKGRIEKAILGKDWVYLEKLLLELDIVSESLWMDDKDKMREMITEVRKSIPHD